MTGAGDAAGGRVEDALGFPSFGLVDASLGTSCLVEYAGLLVLAVLVAQALAILTIFLRFPLTRRG